MPVTVKSMNGMNALGHLGVNTTLLNWLIDNKVEVTLTKTDFQFEMPLSPPVKHSVPVLVSQLQALNAGKLDPQVMFHLRENCEEAISSMAYTALLDKQGETIAEIIEKPLGLAMSVLPPLHPEAVPLTESKVTTEPGVHYVHKVEVSADAPKPSPVVKPAPIGQKWLLWPLVNMKTDPPEQLRNASYMYQPVKGTSPNSRYFLVGATADLRVAIKISGSSMSVRIEGVKFAPHIPKLTELGFGNAANKIYASLHLEVKSKLQAQKALGAILFGLGAPIETPTPDLSILGVK